MSASPAHGQTVAKDVYKHSLSSIMLLAVDTVDGEHAIGTGFLAMADGVAVTAWHVVRDAASVKAVFADGEECEVPGLIAHDAAHDVALIKVRVKGRRLLDLSNGRPDIGSAAFLIGNPKNIQFTESEGVFSKVQKTGDDVFYQYTASTSPGNSGGPLLDESGVARGVVSFQYTRGQNLNFAIPAYYVLAMDWMQPVTPWKSVQSLDPQQTLSNDDMDVILADSLAELWDSFSTVFLLRRLLFAHPDLVKNGVPTLLTDLQDDCVSCRTKLRVNRSDDAVRERTRLSLADSVAAADKALEKMADLIRNEQDGKWTADDDKAAYNLNSLLDIGHSSEDDMRVLLASRAFVQEQPMIAAKLEVSSVHDPQATGSYDIDVKSLIRDTTIIVSVGKTGIGAKLGLDIGDILETFNGVAISSVADLTEKVRTHQGKKVKIGVRRYGEDVVLEPTVPEAETSSAAPSTGAK